jgi:hypothetical protein
MDTMPTAVSGHTKGPDPQAGSATPALRRAWHSFRGRVLGGLMVVYWGSEQTSQTIFSGGLTAPSEISYFRARPAPGALDGPPQPHQGPAHLA